MPIPTLLLIIIFCPVLPNVKVEACIVPKFKAPLETVSIRAFIPRSKFPLVRVVFVPSSENNEFPRLVPLVNFANLPLVPDPVRYTGAEGTGAIENIIVVPEFVPDQLKPIEVLPAGLIELLLSYITRFLPSEPLSDPTNVEPVPANVAVVSVLPNKTVQLLSALVVSVVVDGEEADTKLLFVELSG